MLLTYFNCDVCRSIAPPPPYVIGGIIPPAAAMTFCTLFFWNCWLRAECRWFWKARFCEYVRRFEPVAFAWWVKGLSEAGSGLLMVS